MISMPQKRKIELLAPARTAGTAIEAVRHGADAVYIGADQFGARSSACNSVADIRRAVDFAHQFNARVFATVNTVLFDDELLQAEKLIRSLYVAGVDALIVQDMGILRLDIPPIALHASTQCDIRTPEKARFLQSVGFSRLILARELTFDEIRAITDAVTIPVETFIHGALCVSYSGRCQISQSVRGRSANRGECAQFCRLPYDLVDGDGNVLQRDKHLLSLRDLNMSDSLPQLLDAGVSSFKIEGRLKSDAYVKNVVAYYRKAIDGLISADSGKYERASVGDVSLTFNPDLSSSFNRSFTSYFALSRRPANGFRMASVSTPKSLGEYVGPVTRASGRDVKVATRLKLHNGDGFSYFDRKGEYSGFRANRAEGNMITAASPLQIPVGAEIYRTFNKDFDDILSRPSSARRIPLDAALSLHGNVVSLSLSDVRGNRISCSEVLQQVAASNSPQGDVQRAVLAKLGTTVYSLRDAAVLPDVFIPSSFLTALRRRAVDLLDRAQVISYTFRYRLPEDADAVYPSDSLVYSDNVSNALAEKFYRSHGVQSIQPALETGKVNLDAGSPVMHTRYCIRRELGACRLDSSASQLPEQLFLVNDNIRFSVVCDCSRCEMFICRT
ncbi:MAG: U32 family peptidase [Muribaculaceae bacterium]|jgi:collagenase-like PrtC family protease|nr:U32 family peptidase [Muribaculaceae bacterium]